MSGHEAIIVADLGFGDAGKGTTIDHLARSRERATIVRFNGGAQAAHNVITPDGKHHTFSQFGSGMFVPGTSTHLSRFMLFDPIELSKESRKLVAHGCPHPLARVTIARDARVVTPFHRAANRLRERLRGAGAHGTCGLGIGETMADSLANPEDTVYAKDLNDPAVLADKFVNIQLRKRTELLEQASALDDPDLEEEIAILTDPMFPLAFAVAVSGFASDLTFVTEEYLASVARKGDLLFEGAQGVLLDEWRGFHPHTTWSTTTFENPQTLLAEIDYPGHVQKLGVLRAYSTRHGAGPFPTYDAALSEQLIEPHNGKVSWQGTFRCGWFDLVMARYAQSVAGADALMITHLDRHQTIDQPKICTKYEREGKHLQTLALGPHQDLQYQEGLTKLIAEVTPVYEAVPADENEFLERIE